MSNGTKKNLLTTASALRRAGRVLEAIDAYERLLDESPNLPDSWYNLGYLQRQARRFDAALASYGQALARNVGQPEEVHLNRAVIYSDDLARADEAERELNEALQRHPRYVPALLNLGNLQEDRGRWRLAIEAYEKVLSIDPFNALALGRMAGMRPTLDAQESLIARLKAALARPSISLAERADLAFGLGLALDRVASYDEAFVAYCTANRSSQSIAASQGVRYDRAAHERFIDHIIEAFPSTEPRTTVVPASLPRPVFICGMFRSGSTLVEQMLASHSNVTAGGELDLLPGIVVSHLAPFPEEIAATSTTRLQHLRTIYLDRVAALFPDAAVVTDKRPDNFFFIGLIKTLFPEATVLHTSRAPLDNCLSIFFLHLAGSRPYAFDLLDIAHWFGQYRRLMAHWKLLYGETIHDVCYDELVSDPRSAIERVLAHCGLPWDEACLSFHKSDAVVKTASVWQVRQPLYQRSSGRSRHYERHLKDLRAALEAQITPPAAAVGVRP